MSMIPMAFTYVYNMRQVLPECGDFIPLEIAERLSELADNLVDFAKSVAQPAIAKSFAEIETAIDKTPQNYLPENHLLKDLIDSVQELGVSLGGSLLADYLNGLAQFLTDLLASLPKMNILDDKATVETLDIYIDDVEKFTDVSFQMLPAAHFTDSVFQFIAHLTTT